MQIESIQTIHDVALFMTSCNAEYAHSTIGGLAIDANDLTSNHDTVATNLRASLGNWADSLSLDAFALDQAACAFERTDENLAWSIGDETWG